MQLPHVARGPLLGDGDPAPFAIFNAGGNSPFLLLGDHAGNAIPQALGTLELSAQDRIRHISWDIGVRGLGEMLAVALDAPFIHQPYSRLLIDCNRAPDSAEAVLALSDGSHISGNDLLTDDERARRIDEVHQPYHERIAAEIKARITAGRATMVIALHSFTPTMAGIARPWDIGVLHEKGDTSLATAMLGLLARDSTLCVGDNQPYRMDETDYTILRHAVTNGLPYAELEIRQDAIAGEAGQRAWCERLCAVFAAVLREPGMGPLAGHGR
jgi:predicted N-formylglutamate amidohydrolase